MNVQLQQSSDSCGLYAIAMAYHLCDGKDPCHISYTESQMRSHLEKCFVTKTISAFPNESRSLRQKIIEETEVSIYCVCRYPETTSHFGDMVCCDKCSQWCHEDCLQIPRKVFGKDISWVCPYC